MSLVTNERLAVELRHAMTAKPITGRALAAAINVQPDSITRWRNARSFPYIHNADALADHLDAPILRAIAIKELARRCARQSCRRRYFTAPRHRHDSRFCSTACQLSVTRKRYRARKRTRGQQYIQQVDKAITAYCRACEPDGLCRTVTCPLRGVSPFPLIARVRA